MKPWQVNVAQHVIGPGVKASEVFWAYEQSEAKWTVVKAWVETNSNRSPISKIKQLLNYFINGGELGRTADFPGVD